MKSLEYKHYFSVTNGKFIWEDRDMFEYKRTNLEGKRGYAIISQEEPSPSRNQYAYYFGGIIRTECMSSNAFSGLAEYEIHDILFSELRSHTRVVEKADGSTIVRTVTDDFSTYKMEDMRLYLEEVIAYLQVNFNIHPRPSSHYNYNQYRVKSKLIE